MEDTLGPLMDLNNFLDETIPENKQPYIPDFTGKSPAAAKNAGADTSGRVICATTQLSQVLGVNGKDVTIRHRRGLSSLQGALSCLKKSDWETVFVGWTGEIENPGNKNWDGELTPDQIDTAQNLYCEANDTTTVPIWSDSKVREYAEHTIWPIYHYIHTLDVRILNSQDDDGYEHYKKFNQKYADVIARIYQPGDIVWIHDYYLLLLPAMLREKLGPTATIGLFLHCSFPSSEFIRSIPQRQELIEGMLGSSVIGFQSASYARHFLSTCIRVLGNEHQGDNIVHEGRIVEISVQHIGLDVNEVISETQSDTIQASISELKRTQSGLKVIVGRDKLDNAQDVIQKLHAYSLFLEYYPEWRGRVVLIQITTPSYNQDFKADKQIAELISEINGTYGDMEWWPVQHHAQYVSQQEYYALLCMSDLGLFTSIRDSTCYAALEYTACQRNRHCPIIISEFMGITEILADAIKVNPYNPAGVADAINENLASPSPDRSDFEWLKKYSVDIWVQTFLSRLVKHELKHESQHFTPKLNTDLMLSTYNGCEKRLFLFDYDGTLTPIVRDPAAAVPSGQLKSLLTRLCDNEKNEVWIISGRDQEFLDKHFGNFHINLSAEHGCFNKYAGGEWVDLASKMDNSWKPIVVEVMQAYTERTQGSNIEQKKQAIVWHYRRADPVFGAFQASHLRAYLENSVAHSYPVDVMSGKANIEVRPRAYNKGEIVRSIFKDQKVTPGFAICIGDDTTDEDMFRAVNDQKNKQKYFTVSVGEATKLTIASYHLANPQVVLNSLDQLSD